MKTKYIIGLVIAATFIVVAYFSFSTSKIDYSSFTDAKPLKKVVQIIGSWNKNKPTEYDIQKNVFTFFMYDEKKGESKVLFAGPKPQNFDIAPTVVVKGKFNGDVFEASEILTKCPSKYEGKAEDLKKNN